MLCEMFIASRTTNLVVTDFPKGEWHADDGGRAIPIVQPESHSSLREKVPAEKKVVYPVPSPFFQVKPDTN